MNTTFSANDQNFCMWLIYYEEVKQPLPLFHFRYLLAVNRFFSTIPDRNSSVSDYVPWISVSHANKIIFMSDKLHRQGYEGITIVLTNSWKLMGRCRKVKSWILKILSTWFPIFSPSFLSLSLLLLLFSFFSPREFSLFWNAKFTLLLRNAINDVYSHRWRINEYWSNKIIDLMKLNDY